MPGVLERARRRAVLSVQRATDRMLERRFGVDTARHVSHEELGIESNANRTWHHPSDWISVRRAFARLEPSADDVFVDIGSGLGRAVLLAARFPFRRVIGVELSEELTAVARANVQRRRDDLRCGDVELVTADALAWEIPDDVTVFYLYSPLTGDLFARLFERILESVERRPRVARLVYNYPVEHVRVVESGRAEVLDVSPRSWPARKWASDDVIVTYLVLPSGGRAAIPGPVPRASPRLAQRAEWLGAYDPGFSLEKPASARSVGKTRSSSSAP